MTSHHASGLSTGISSRSFTTFTSLTMLRMHMKMFKPKKDITLNTTEKVLELLQPVRYKPTSVDEMAEETKFSRSEVKFLYRAFKQECPNGIIDEETFKEVYENIFPLGDASKYAHLVFKCIDKEETGISLKQECKVCHLSHLFSKINVETLFAELHFLLNIFPCKVHLNFNLI